MYAAYVQAHYYSRHNNGTQDPIQTIGVYDTLAEAQAAADAAQAEQSTQHAEGRIELRHNQASSDTFGAVELSDDAALAASQGLEYGSEAWAAWCASEAGPGNDAGKYEYVIVRDEYVAATEYGVRIGY